MKKEMIIVDKRETFVQSFYKDLATFGLLSLFAWVSYGDTFWTFVCGLLLLVYALGFVKKFDSEQVKLKSKQDAIEWANSLEDF